MLNSSLTTELLKVKQQLAEAQLLQDTSVTANKTAEDAQKNLLLQMEKNYIVAQRVQEEKKKRQESDHYIKGLRDQMKEATSRAMLVATELEREKAKNRGLRDQIVQSQKNRLERLDDVGQDDDDGIYEDDSDHRSEEDDDQDDDHIEQPVDERPDVAEQPDNNRVEYQQLQSLTNRPRRKKKKRRGTKKKKKSSNGTMGTTGTTGTTVATKNRHNNSTTAVALRRRPSTTKAGGSRSTPQLNVRAAEKLRLSKNHSTELFHRLADAKRSIKTHKAESAAKSKQLHALSNHLEKMMSLLRAEAAAKASAEEALRSTEDELDDAKQEIARLQAQVGGMKKNEKNELSRDYMLSKQLELMDIKYATLMKTNNFNRAKEQRDGKELTRKMHATTEKMHTMLRRCEDSEIANRNTVHAFSCLLSNLSKMDRTPFRLNSSSLVPVTRSELVRNGSDLANELITIELQDCSLGNQGGLEIMQGKEREKSCCCRVSFVCPVWLCVCVCGCVVSPR
jgi:hypothetical protein